MRGCSEAFSQQTLYHISGLLLAVYGPLVIRHSAYKQTYMSEVH